MHSAEFAAELIFRVNDSTILQNWWSYKDEDSSNNNNIANINNNHNANKVIDSVAE